MRDYKIIYEPSFVIFWGLALSAGLFVGGLLTIAAVAMAMLILITHEHAHIEECNRVNIGINSVRFTWLGGMVDFRDADAWYAGDIVSLLLAGVKDTGAYSISFIFVLVILNYLGRNVVLGFNFANNPYINFVNSVVLFSGVLFIGHFLPITYKTKSGGLISPDGWAALRFMELRDELWNDGKSLAMMVVS